MAQKCATIQEITKEDLEKRSMEKGTKGNR